MKKKAQSKYNLQLTFITNNKYNNKFIPPKLPPRGGIRKLENPQLTAQHNGVEQGKSSAHLWKFTACENPVFPQPSSERWWWTRSSRNLCGLAWWSSRVWRGGFHGLPILFVGLRREIRRKTLACGARSLQLYSQQQWPHHHNSYILMKIDATTTSFLVETFKIPFALVLVRRRVHSVNCSVALLA